MCPNPTPNTAHIVLRVPKRVAFPLFTLLLILGIIEVGWRISDWRKEVKARSREDTGMSSEARLANGRRVSPRPASLAAVHHPHLTVRLAKGSVAGRVEVNEDGFRGRRLERRKPPGTARVALTGGSVAFGFGASDDAHTLAPQLEKRLPAGTEVMNAAAIGYVATQELVLYATELAEFSPDVVLTLTGWNDVVAGLVTPPSRPLYPIPFWEFDDLAERSFSLPERLIGWSAAWRGLKRKADRLQDAARAQRFAATDSLHPDCLPRYERALTQLARLARGNGATAVICLQPELFTRRPRTAAEEEIAKEPPHLAGLGVFYPRAAEVARRVAERERVPFIDGGKAFEGVTETVFMDSVHLNDRGNEILAEYLAKEVAPLLKR